MKTLLLPILTSASLSLLAADDEGFIPMFNGRDLARWTQINRAPETWTAKPGKAATGGAAPTAVETDA